MVLRSRLHRGTALLLTALLVAALAGPAAAQTAPQLCPERFPITRSATTQHLAYCTSQPLAVADPSITRLVVLVHGDNRDAVDYHRHLLDAAALAGADGTLLLAPQFLTPADLPAADTTLSWSSSGWKQGNNSTPEGTPWRMSSFEALDRLVSAVTSGPAFPNLDTVVIAGHSAGGQYSGRHAAISELPTSLRSAGRSVRYVVANPSSYLYLDGARPQQSNGKKGVRFSTPSAKQVAACPDYDTYKYGLEGLNAYGAARGPALIGMQLQERAVTYLLGESDTAITGSLDTSCAANLQGPNRLERGLAYHAYLGHHYGSQVLARHVLRTVPRVAHDGRAMFLSAAGRQALFD